MATYETTRSEQRERAKRTMDAFCALVDLNKATLTAAEKADSRQLSVTTQVGETRGSSTLRDAMAENAVAWEELAGKLREQSEVLGPKLDELNRLLHYVISVDPLAGRVLTRRYMCVGRQPEFCEIAEQMGYSTDYICEKHRDGLDIVAGIIFQ